MSTQAKPQAQPRKQCPEYRVGDIVRDIQTGTIYTVARACWEWGYVERRGVYTRQRTRLSGYYYLAQGVCSPYDAVRNDDMNLHSQRLELVQSVRDRKAMARKGETP